MTAAAEAYSSPTTSINESRCVADTEIYRESWKFRDLSVPLPTRLGRDVMMVVLRGISRVCLVYSYCCHAKICRSMHSLHISYLLT